jgi:hypothetical protein
MPKHTLGLSPDVLNAALHGLEAQKQMIEQHVETVRSMLGIRADGQKRRGRPPKSVATVPAESAPPAPKRRRFSAATRARMADAQRKRYAALRKATEVPPKKAVAKKRKLSAAGRKRIIEATKRRWAAYKAKKAAS